MDKVLKQLSQRQTETLGINRTEKHCLPDPWLGKHLLFFAQFLLKLKGERHGRYGAMASVDCLPKYLSRATK